MNKSKIEWGWFKILLTLVVFLFTIGIVFISLMPVLDGRLKATDTFTLLIGLACSFRMLEFLSVSTTSNLFLWIFSTLVLDMLGFFGLNYTDMMGILEKIGQSSGSAPAPEG
ncbi:hypothetical protein NEDG_00972 [Nematocida displodere]|uniref:Uncharacterized protein n=1 Tax=Nematocida displodere TaxID=1805483 RepID=A0A177EA71_9MICR|nr:hypothetical protein NEDG_00972 [Nematocida displodere]